MADMMADTIAQIQTGLVRELSRLVPNSVIFIWNLAIAIIILGVGWLLGHIAKQIVVKILQMAKLDEWATKHKLQTAIGGMQLSALAGAFVKWYVLLLFLVQALAFIGLTRIETFGWDLAKIIPLWLLGALIVVTGLIVGKFVRNKIEQIQHRFKKTAAIGAELIIVYIAVVTALDTIGISTTILISAFTIAFTAFVLVIAIILGISFGLAFKKDARALVNELKREMG